MKKHTLILFVLYISLSSFVGNAASYEPLDKVNPIDFRGDHIRYKGARIVLGEKAFFIDGRLSDTDVARYPFVFNDVNEALKELKDGSEAEPMTLYIAPYVYWIDDPDDPAVRKSATGRGGPFGQVVKCNGLRFYGLTDDPVNVVLACRRGQTQGSEGNFTMFYIDGNEISSENVTFGNYCNVDLEFPLMPELNRPRRSSTVTQAQLIICNSDKVVARNTHFISRLNLCPFSGAKRALFDNCYFESTDDALCGTGVYLNSRFTFFSSKPFYSTQGTGAVFLNCDFDVLTREKQYLTKAGSPVTLVDSRFKHSSGALYIGWTQDPANDLRCYQYNVSLNGVPVFIEANKPEVTIDMTGKPILEAYRLEYNGEVIYNTYNLLRGADDWDPMGVKAKVLQIEKQTGKNLTRIPTYFRLLPASAAIETGVNEAVLRGVVKRFGNHTYDGEPISWFIRPEDQALVRLNHHSATDSCTIAGVNNQEETKEVIVQAATPTGLSAASTLTVAPKYLEAPRFTALPRIVQAGKGKLAVDYALDLEGRKDQSLITWYRCSDSPEKLQIPVAVSRLNEPEYTYPLSDADVGYYIMVEVSPKHLRCHPGKPATARTAAVVGSDDVVPGYAYSTDFRNFPSAYQPRILPGFWTADAYKPLGLDAYNWTPATAGDAWYYGRGVDGMKGVGLVPQQKGARLLYTPVKGDYGDMSVALNVDPGKSAGQGFGSATGQYLEVYIKYDTQSLTGYGLRIIRTVKYDHAVDFILMKYENGVATPISDPVSAICFRTGCTIELRVEGNRLIAHVETATPLPDPVSSGLKKTVDIQAEIVSNRFGGIGVQHTGSVGASAIMLHSLQVNMNSKVSKDEVLKTMRAATGFLMDKLSYKGGFVWTYLPDLSRRWGELEAYPTMAWVQPPGTPSVGHLLLDAYHATGDEFYYESATTVANALIWGQLPCGGWNYMFDFAGENSLKQWYATIGRQGWRLEEFQHYYGNATFDDGGTIHAAKFLLRMYVEKNDPAFRPAVEKAIRFVLDSQYPVGGWPQRYPLMYDHPFQGKKDYSSFITLNDDVSMENIEFLLQCYQALGIQDIKEPIIRAMNLLILLQQGTPYAGWADQYTVEDLKPAHARSYEPRAINTQTTVETCNLLMECYRLTGESKFIAGIPAAIKFLESAQLPQSELERYATPGRREGYDVFAPRMIDPDTGKPLFIHRMGSNVVNGHYYINQDISSTVGHYTSCTFLNVAALKTAYEKIKNTPVAELTKGSPLVSTEYVPLDKYYTRNRSAHSDKDVRELIKGLSKEGYWLAPLRMISHPFQPCPPMEPSRETKYTSTRVGDIYDTSCFYPEETVMGISITDYMANMMTLIGYLEN